MTVPERDRLRNEVTQSPASEVLMDNVPQFGEI
jgi:hypothetical protein